jgi:hypothetical protein
VPLGYDVVARKLIVNESEAPRVRRVFEIFAETGSGIETVARLRAEGATSKAGRPLDKCDVYKLLNNRTYVGDGRQPEGMTLPGLMEPLPIIWPELRLITGPCGTPSARFFGR